MKYQIRLQGNHGKGKRGLLAVKELKWVKIWQFSESFGWFKGTSVRLVSQDGVA